MFFVAILSLAIAAGCKDSTAAEPQPNQNPKSGQTEVSDIQVGTSSAKQLEAAKATLAATVRGDAQGEMLLAYFDQHAVQGKLERPGIFSYDSIDAPRIKSREAFLLIMSDKEQRGGGTMNFSHDPTNRILFIPQLHTFSSLWSGVMLAHELYHAYENRDPKASILNEADPAFYQEEIEAHALQFRLLDRHTGNGFTREVENFVRQNPAPADFPWAFFTPETYDDFRAIDNLLPPARSVQEMNSRTGSYVIAVNFRYADLKGGTQDKILFYRNLRRIAK
jgi:hypothetical protein